MIKKCNICKCSFNGRPNKLSCSEQCTKIQHNLKKQAWKRTNRDRELKNLKKSYLLNKKDRIKAKIKWQKDNKDKANASYAKRRARKLKAQIGNYENEIKSFFENAKNLQEVDGIKRHIHHIIPLQQYENIVCGLHVPWNLQILTEDEHRKAHEELRMIYGTSNNAT